MPPCRARGLGGGGCGSCRDGLGLLWDPQLRDVCASHSESEGPGNSEPGRGRRVTAGAAGTWMLSGLWPGVSVSLASSSGAW